MLTLLLPMIVQADNHEPVDGSEGGSSTNIKDVCIEKLYNELEFIRGDYTLSEFQKLLGLQTAFSQRLDDCIKDKGNTGLSSIQKGVRDLLYSVLVEPLTHIFVWLGGQFIPTLLSPSLFHEIFGSTAGESFLFSLWKLVRNLLNVMFILVLLFSAFSTIFQVQKWHLKQVLLQVVVMALLVNFSWPVTRVLIDLGNVLTYGILGLSVPLGGELVSGVNLIGAIASEAKTLEALVPDPSSNDQMSITDLLVRGLFVLLFVMTLAAVGILFLVRLVMFVVLLVFSPIGFVAAIFPGTKRFAAMWWDVLLKWTFLAPILVFMLFVSFAFISTMKSSATLQSVSSGISNTGELQGSFGATMILYSAAIVMLWVGISAATQMGGSIAGAALNKSKRLGMYATRRGWKMSKGVGRTADNLSVATQKKLNKGRSVSVAGGLGRIKGVRQRFSNMARDNIENFNARKAQGVSATVGAGSFTGKAGNINTALGAKQYEAANRANERRVNELKALKDNHVDSQTAMRQLSTATDKVSKEALVDYLTEQKGFGKQVETAQYADLIKAISGLDASFRKKIDGSIASAGNAHIPLDYRVSGGENLSTVVKDLFDGMNGEDLAKQSLFKQAVNSPRNENYQRAITSISARVSRSAQLQAKMLENMSGETHRYAQRAGLPI